jgi:hypothetical protein
MTQLPYDTDAWRRAGADAKPPASGEQIDRDPATEAGHAGAEHAADAERTLPDPGDAQPGAESARPDDRESTASGTP